MCASTGVPCDDHEGHRAHSGNLWYSFYTALSSLDAELYMCTENFNLIIRAYHTCFCTHMLYIALFNKFSTLFAQEHKISDVFSKYKQKAGQDVLPCLVVIKLFQNFPRISTHSSPHNDWKQDTLTLQAHTHDLHSNSIDLPQVHWCALLRMPKPQPTSNAHGSGCVQVVWRSISHVPMHTCKRSCVRWKQLVCCIYYRFAFDLRKKSTVISVQLQPQIEQKFIGSASCLIVLPVKDQAGMCSHVSLLVVKDKGIAQAVSPLSVT